MTIISLDIMGLTWRKHVKNGRQQILAEPVNPKTISIWNRVGLRRLNKIAVTFTTKNLPNILIFGFSAILISFTINNPFYWDNTVQLSIPANWYYQTNFKFFYLPDSIATGHPTFVGMYFALLWKLFGRSLIICHLGMFPFVFGLLIQLKTFLTNIKVTGNTKIYPILGFIILDATFLSQLSLITFDIIQLFFFFLCLNYILTHRNKALLFSYLILTLISLRGSIMAAGILVFSILYDKFYLNKKIQIRNYLVYIPGILALILFLLLFKINKGWVIHNTVSNEWDTSGEIASLKRMIWNSIIFIWRLIDFGRIGVYLVFIFFIFKSIALRRFQDNTLKLLLLIILSQLIFFFPILITSQIPFGHRYLLPIIVPTTILTIYYLQNFTNHPLFWQSSILIVLLSGHFWLYPLKTSQGWDATTMHWSYISVSEKMNLYVKANNIEKDEIGTFFPNNQSRYLTHIEDDKNDIYSGISFKNKYIIFSNAFNVNPSVIDSLFSPGSNWKLEKKYTKNRIFMSLYSKD